MYKMVDIIGRLKVSEHVLYKAIAKKEIPEPLRKGNEFLWSEELFEDWLEKNPEYLPESTSFLTQTEIAAQYSITIQKLYTLRALPDFPMSKTVLTRKKWKAEDVHAWFEKHPEYNPKDKNVLTIKEIKRKYGLSYLTIIELLELNVFPEPFSEIRGRKKWRKSDIESWIEYSKKWEPTE